MAICKCNCCSYIRYSNINWNVIVTKASRYNIVLTPEDNYDIPSIITITISDVEYSVDTVNNTSTNENITFDSSINTLTLDSSLFTSQGTDVSTYIPVIIMATSVSQ